MLGGVLFTACAEPTLLGDDGASTAEAATTDSDGSAPLHAYGVCGPAGGPVLMVWADAGSPAGCDETVPDEPDLLVLLEQSGNDFVLVQGGGSHSRGHDGVLHDVLSATLTVSAVDATSVSGTLELEVMGGRFVYSNLRSLVDVPLCVDDSIMCL